MNTRICAVIICTLLLVLPRLASAQERGGGDLAVGYNALYLFAQDAAPSLTLPAGFFVSGGAHVGRGNVMLVGEIADSTKSVTDFGVSSTASILTYAGGIRIASGRFRRGPREGARPFVELLIGGARFSAGLAGQTVLTGDALAVMPGAGVDVPVGRHTAVRIAGKFELFHSGGGTDHAFRFDVGVAFGGGRR